MGISGLLPALKSIQDTKHLSEFAGKTIAVDAYVWLHRGVMGCATELATGKDTHKYVDYAMHRVRLLRHHQIEPYIVFDGGPLSAKKGTEVERKKRREENLARGNVLSVQGRHTQARECYVKCVDVTPQMAFQFIKALREESVSYIVAPYEADAQLAYLERIGLVDGILTEDSDLLVFGCRNVLFKLDIVARTVVNIKREKFASVVASSADSNGISLVGWSDKQFRAMAILSGCDYLPSIPGIGLKTACSMLRKWKTVEQVVRVVALEGKKSVPKGYLEQFKLAEKCFLHQRVYCPNRERLVHLNEVDGTLDDTVDAYIGGDIEPSIAKKIALGDADPITLLPMKDINPGFMPRALKTVSVESRGANKDNRKGKEKATTPAKEGILSFFGPNPKIPPRKERYSSPIHLKKPVSGKASGKRTLAEVMDQDIATTRKQRSKFFGSSKSPKSKGTTNSSSQASRKLSKSAPGPSRLTENKENFYIVIDDDNDEIEIDSTLSMKAQGEVDKETEVILNDPSGYDVVEQEDGYISPVLSCSGELQDLSSPVQPRRTPLKGRGIDLEFGAEVVSSPEQGERRRRPTLRPPNRTRSLDFPRANSHTDGRGGPHAHDDLNIIHPDTLPASFPGPDLRHSFGDDQTSDIDCSGDEAVDLSKSTSSLTPTPSPPMPVTPDDEFFDPEDSDIKAYELRKKAVVKGWRDQWALKKGPTLMRRETNVTPTGRHSLSHSLTRFRPYPVAGQPCVPKAIGSKDAKSGQTWGRKSLSFCEAVIPDSPMNFGIPDTSVGLNLAEHPMGTGGIHK